MPWSWKITTITSSAREVIAELQQAGHRRAGRVAGEDALFARDAPRHDRRVLVGHLLEVIDDVKSTFFGRKSSPMPSVMYG